MGKLYDINTDYLRIIEAVEEAEGELTPELQEQLAANGEDFRDKIENYLKAVKNYEADAEAYKAEAASFFAKAKQAAAIVERLKQTVTAAMQLRGMEKERFGNFIASLRRSERVTVDDNLIQQLPDKYKRIKYEADKTALKEALKAGEQVDGAQLTTNYSLLIK